MNRTGRWRDNVFVERLWRSRLYFQGEAARSEFRKLEEPVNEAEFRLIQSLEAKT